MLFDIRGKRKRVVQVIYVSLALLMGVGLVGLGIGGGANGGLFDAIGLGGNSTSPSNPTYDNQISKANDALAANPVDEKALLTLARYEFLSAQSSNETDAKGQINLTDDSVTHYNNSIDAWERYIATKPKQPDDSVASLVVQAYQFVINTDSPLVEKQLAQLVGAAQVVADARPSQGTYSQLAAFAYIAGDDKTAAAAEKSALAEATDEAAKTQIKQQLQQAKQQGALIAQQIKQSAPDRSELQNPTSGLGGSGSSLLPPPTTAPAPTP